jgi:hypothetical protein
MRKEQTGSIDRRRLLKGAGLAAGAAAATSAVAAKGAAKGAANEAAAAGAERKPPSALYRETEDVRTYYKSARY